MAMLRWEQAWRRFATPTERALARATRNIDADLAADVIERAKQAGYRVTFGEVKRGRRRRAR